MNQEAAKGYSLQRKVVDPKWNLEHLYHFQVRGRTALILNFCFKDAFAVSWPTKLTSAEFVHHSARFLQDLSRADFTARPPTSDQEQITITPNQRVLIPPTYSGHGQNNIHVSGQDNHYPDCYIPFEDLSDTQLTDGKTTAKFLRTKSGYKINLGKNRFVRINTESCTLIFGGEFAFSRSFTYWSHLIPDIDLFFNLIDETTKRKISQETFSDILSILIGSPIGENVFPQGSVKPISHST